MLITIHNSKLEKVAFIDNDKQDTLNFYNDKFSQYLLTASATFEFTVYKKGIKSDTIKEKAYQTLTERSFVSFKSNGKTYLFNVMSTEENDTEIHCYCENLNLELLNEYAGPYKSNNQLSFVEYCNLFGILKNGAITIGVNEVSDFRRTIEWTGQDTNLKRLLSIANNFDAEIEFETKLNNDSTLKSFIMNIYRKNDGKNQGVGKRRDDIVLEYGKNIKNVKRKIDKNIIFNAVKPTGHATATATTTTVKQGAKKLGTVSWSGGNLNYAGHNISSDVVGQILTLCTQHKLLPSGVFSQLYLESWWGASNVARVDNNWGGLTWTGNGNRPSGVVVTQGTARPANEGGYYMHFASVSDYMKDYTYLLAEQGIYKVKGASTIDAYTKGLFKVGGATYDYATAGYAHYASLMRDIRSGINRNNNNAMDNLDNQYRSIGTVGTAPVQLIATKTKDALAQLGAIKGQRVGSGQCYALSALYSLKLGGPGLGGGVTSLRGLIGAGMAASQIGTDYNWAQFGWKVVVPNKVADLIPGSIANIKANFNGGFIITGGWGHTVVIKAISGDTLTVLEQNFAGHQYVEERTYSASAYLGAIQTLCYPPEIVQGKRIDGTTQAPPEQQNTETSTSTQEKILEIRPDLYREYKNDAGQVEFYVKNGAVYAPLSKDLYPSAFTGIETDDNWIRKDFDIQTDSEEVLIQEAIKLLKKNAYPEITYEIDGYSTDLAIGDTVKIYDKSFSPKLILEARVTEQHTSFTNPSQNKSVFDNFKALESKISSTLTDRMNEMVEETKPYDLRLITDNGTSFKNGEGISVLTAELWKNNKKFGATYQFKSGDKLLSAGLELMVKAIDLTPNEPLIITVDAYIGNDYVASKQVTFINVNDGINGSKGADGNGIASTVIAYQAGTSATVAPTGTWSSSPVSVPAGQFLWTRTIFTYTDTTTKTIYSVSRQGQDGAKGADGIAGKDGVGISSTVITYGLSANETTQPTTWTSSVPTLVKGQYLWTKTVWTYTDAKTETGYTKTYIAKDGNNGADGIAGKDGVGILSTSITYQASTSGTTVPTGTWSSQVPSVPNGQFLWTRTVWNYTDSTSETGYSVSKMGENGQSSYTHIAYATNSTGTSGFSVSDNVGKTYIGMYVDQIATDSTDPTKYKWNLIKGQDGAQGIQGPAGADGKTPYWHTAYSNSSDGKTDFSITDSTNKRFIGQYTDYTQADSTDYTKYKWVDMTANVKVGNNNLLVNTKTLADNYFVANNTSETYLGGTVATGIAPSGSYRDTYRQAMKIAPEGNEFIVSFYAKSSIDNVTINNHFYSPNRTIKGISSTGALFNSVNGGDGLIAFKLTTQWKRYWIKWTIRDASSEAENVPMTLILGRNFDSVNSVSIALPALYAGNLNTEHSEAPEDTQLKIDSKADQALTQAQMLALEERSALARDNAIAEAMKNTISEVEAKWQTWYNLNTADEKQKVANDIASLFERVAEFEQNLGEASARFEFINNETLIGEEGVAIGDKEGKAKLFLSNDSISFVTNGVAQMTLTGDTLTIKNGLFTERIQIGNYVEEVYDRNPLYNVIRPIKYS
ncbi:glucosaminidase domain-containing protein [Streptococcus uberis]|uniref:glucosaminidase domain-containing protein n=1 Tax=Streptococcus uberis TaxID=1349 RepID=UPI0020BD921A|nr:glucosaminidase domain-containing protein [Streptococcus uberis]